MGAALVSRGLGEVTVLSPEGGAPVALASLWADRPVVLAFVRHFG